VRRRCGRSGQAMVELAIILPLMVLLFLGSWTAADLIGDNDTALQATRAGARYAAELGAAAPTTTVTFCASTLQPQTCQVDDQVIQQMLPIVIGNMPNAVVNEIDIYEPDGGGGPGNPGCGAFSSTCPPDAGAYNSQISPSELIDKYTINGSTITPANTPQYLLSDRWQVHPDEAELGVRILFTYTSPTLKIFTQQDSRYTVVRLAAEE